MSMSSSSPSPSADEGMGERLTRLAASLVTKGPDDPGYVAADLAAIRKLVERAVRSGAGARPGPKADAIERDVSVALADAGLGALVEDRPDIARVRHRLARLHALVTAMSIARAGRAPT